MGPRVLLASAATVLLAIVACSSNDDRPPPTGGCVVVDGSKCTTTVIGGSSSGSEGGVDGGGCSVSAGASQCGECATTSCCSELVECQNSTYCTNLLSCEDDCGGGTSCITACQNQFPTGVSTLQLLSSCLTRDCLVCNESGIGDPCSPGYPACETGLTCNGLWCTKACIRSTDCTGIGADGTNILGFTNACMATAHGNLCTPGCGGTPAACTDFAGTYCFATTDDDGNLVSVCSALPDASTGD
jgi:hypothetical protein